MECSVEPTREYLEATGVKVPWVLLALPYRNHTDQRVLRDLPERAPFAGVAEEAGSLDHGLFKKSKAVREVEARRIISTINCFD